MNQPTMLTYSDLAKRWGRNVKTIRNMVAEKKIKLNKATNLFSLDYIEAIEKADIDLETVSAFRLRALERENERLREEKAVMASSVYQAMAALNEAAARLAGQAV